MMYHTRWLRVIATLLAIVGVTALAQAQPGWGRGRGPQVVSPQLQNDGSVQFQLLAANAQSVSLVSPDLGGMPKPGEMTQNDQGIWSLTYGPVDPPHRHALPVQR